MKTILVGNCTPEQVYQLADPDAPNEAELEYKTVKILSCIYPDFHCIVFGGSFSHSERLYRPDLALIARDFSHWFVIEVELIAHSFVGHALPQARAFRYGEPQPDCVTIISRELGISAERSRTLINHVPRTVAVIANKPDESWEIALRSHDIQFLTVSWFLSPDGMEAIELGGTLEVMQESLGFGVYSAVDKSIRFSRVVRLPVGPIQINDPQGGASVWMVARSDGFTWVTKQIGIPDISDGAYVQLVRTDTGRIFLRRA
jgi:hypothetical protein